jgi:excisionase family DNA binding protein
MEERLVNLIRSKFRELNGKLDAMQNDLEHKIELNMLEEKIISIKEAANLFGVTEKTIRNAIKDKELRSVPFRNSYKVYYSEVLRLIGFKKNNETN